MHRFTHPTLQLLERDVSDAGADADQIRPGWHFFHRVGRNCTKAAAVGIPLDGGADTPGNRVGHVPRAVPGLSRNEVYRYRSRPGTAARLAELGEHACVWRAGSRGHRSSAGVGPVREPQGGSGRQADAAATAPVLDDRLAGSSRHAVPEAVLPRSLPGVGLERALHIALDRNSARRERRREDPTRLRGSSCPCNPGRIRGPAAKKFSKLYRAGNEAGPTGERG